MTEQEAVKKFIDQVRWLHEPEFGDFKRKVGLYIHRLVESVPALKQGSSSPLISKMREDVLFNPNGNIEGTRKQILELAQKVMGSGH